MLKRKIRRVVGEDLKINIPIEGVADPFLGGSDSLISFIKNQQTESLNTTEDIDKIRFSTETTTNLSFEFYNGSTYDTSFQHAGFTSSELNIVGTNVFKSFFLLQVYDVNIPTTQQKLHDGYYNGYRFILENNTNAIFTLDGTSEFEQLYLPNNYVNEVNGVTTIYGKLSFFNGKTGNLHLFQNKI